MGPVRLPCLKGAGDRDLGGDALCARGVQCEVGGLWLAM